MNFGFLLVTNTTLNQVGVSPCAKFKSFYFHPQSGTNPDGYKLALLSSFPQTFALK